MWHDLLRLEQQGQRTQKKDKTFHGGLIEASTAVHNALSTHAEQIIKAHKLFVKYNAYPHFHHSYFCLYL